MTHHLHIVTGAPGAGKSTAIEAFLSKPSEFVAFDMDSLLDVASGMVGLDIRTTPSTWPSYNVMWFELLHVVSLNGRVPVLFSPIRPLDVERMEKPPWCDGIRWLLLDCPDDVRRERLQERPDWTEPMVCGAMKDAGHLRSTIKECVNTDRLTPSEVVERITGWLTNHVFWAKYDDRGDDDGSG